MNSNIGTYLEISDKTDKISLSCSDDKRFALDDGVHTLAYFHKDCNKKDCNDKKRSAIMEKVL